MIRFLPRRAQMVSLNRLGGARRSRARNIPESRIGQSHHASKRRFSNESAVSVLEADKPADAISIHHLAVGGTPWA